jgi:hypothetical protein
MIFRINLNVEHLFTNIGPYVVVILETRSRSCRLRITLAFSSMVPVLGMGRLMPGQASAQADWRIGG